jgi:hypothetical protein
VAHPAGADTTHVKRAVIAVAGLAVAAAAYLYWASDERQIRRLLEGVADAVSQEEGRGGVAGLAEVAGLTSYLAPDVTLEPGPPFRAISGAQDVVSTVGRIRAVMTAVRLEISDPVITVDDGVASVAATARLTLRDRDGAESVDVRDVVIALAKREAGWVVTAVRVVQVVEG